MSIYDPMAGHFSFLSYRDPHLAETLKVYDEAVDVAMREEIAESDFDKAVIGTIALLDRPMDPAMKGYTAMIRDFSGITKGVRQKFRDRIFEASPASVRKAAESYLTNAVNRSGVAVYASGDNLQKANEELDMPLNIEPLTSPSG
jgi:hypothetical protein